MFDAPDIIKNIPDIAEIYRINDRQAEELDAAVQELDDNIFLLSMRERMIERWEAMLGLTPMDDDTLEERRFRVQAKVMEKLPYSLRVVLRKLDTMCPDGYVIEISDSRLEVWVRLNLKSKKMITNVKDLLENVLPLNMAFDVKIIWNQYGTLAGYTHAYLAGKTYRELREEIL